MNGLKKFQEFALNADEQKNVKGGLLAGGKTTCYMIEGDTLDPRRSFNSAGEAADWCAVRSNCAFCI